MQERFFHIRPSLNNGGATVRVTPSVDEHALAVYVQVAFCHTKQGGKGDPYCKKVGRETAGLKPAKLIPLRYLPKELENIHAEAIARSGGTWGYKGQFDFAVKYFLPKE